MIDDANTTEGPFSEQAFRRAKIRIRFSELNQYFSENPLACGDCSKWKSSSCPLSRIDKGRMVRLFPIAKHPKCEKFTMTSNTTERRALDEERTMLKMVVSTFK